MSRNGEFVKNIIKDTSKMFYITTLKGIAIGIIVFYINTLNIINIRYSTAILLLLLMIIYISLLKIYFKYKDFEILRKNLRSYMILNFIAWYLGTLIFLINLYAM